MELTKAEAYGHLLAAITSHEINADAQGLAAEVDQVVKELDAAYAHSDTDTQIELDLRKAEAGGRLAMLLASDVANSNSKAIAQDVTQVINELDTAYASASADAQTEWTTLKSELTQAVQALENETADAVKSDTTIVGQYLACHPDTLSIIIGVVLTELGIRSPEIHNIVPKLCRKWSKTEVTARAANSDLPPACWRASRSRVAPDAAIALRCFQNNEVWYYATSIVVTTNAAEGSLSRRLINMLDTTAYRQSFFIEKGEYGSFSFSSVNLILNHPERRGSPAGSHLLWRLQHSS